MTRRHGARRARPRRRTGETGGRQRAVPVLFALVLLAMPVSYRAGTATSHPHSFVVFLADAAAGSMNHHAPVAEPERGHGGHMGGTAKDETVSVVTSAPPGTPAFDRLGPTNEPAGAIGLILAGSLALWLVGAAGVFARVGVLVGRTVRPLFPPPKASLAFG